MDTEILSVGTEILLGHIVNSDARDISQRLSEIGVNVKYHTVVGDNPQRLRDCVKTAKQRADIIITTGGLGPTCDDLTKQILAEAFDVRLVRDEKEAQNLRDYVTNGRVITENNYAQAMLPEGCTVFHNTCGTAPGCAFEKDGVTVIMLPGPPKECNAMMLESVIPYLKNRSGCCIVSHSLRVFGLSESKVDDMFRDEMNAMENPTMAPYAKECDCFLQVTAKAKTEDEAEKMLVPLIEEVSGRLGEYMYGIDVDCLEEQVIKLLREKQMTFSAAESCTGGDVARRFTELPGASAFFKGGCVTYVNAAKATLLGIDRDMIEEEGAVSYEVAKAMAERVREILDTDIGVGVTGLAGPDGDGVHEVGTVFVSMATREETFVRELHLGTKRTRGFIRHMAGNHVYDMIRRYLTGLPIIK